jgi:hypothetical protein
LATRGSDRWSPGFNRDMVVRRPGDTESRRTRSADSGTRLGRGFVQIPKRSFPRVLIRSRPFLSLDVVPLCVCPWREAPDRGFPSERSVGQTAARTPS